MAAWGSLLLFTAGWPGWRESCAAFLRGAPRHVGAPGAGRGLFRREGQTETAVAQFAEVMIGFEIVGSDRRGLVVEFRSREKGRRVRWTLRLRGRFRGQGRERDSEGGMFGSGRQAGQVQSTGQKRQRSVGLVEDGWNCSLWKSGVVGTEFRL